MSSDARGCKKAARRGFVVNAKRNRLLKNHTNQLLFESQWRRSICLSDADQVCL
jgi:hypothetical protein